MRAHADHAHALAGFDLVAATHVAVHLAHVAIRDLHHRDRQIPLDDDGVAGIFCDRSAHLVGDGQAPHEVHEGAGHRPILGMSRACIDIGDLAADRRSVHVNRPREHVDANQHTRPVARTNERRVRDWDLRSLLDHHRHGMGRHLGHVEHAAVSRCDHDRAGRGMALGIAEEAVEAPEKERNRVHQAPACRLAARHPSHRTHQRPTHGPTGCPTQQPKRAAHGP